METQARIYVLFSSELRARLNNRFSLREILAASGIDADVEWRAVPSTDPGERTKALVETVVLASLGAVSVTAAIKLLESAITHYLDHKAVRDSHYDYWLNEPHLDGKGCAIKDAAGKVRIGRRRVGGFDKLPAVPGEGITVSISEKGFDMKVDNDAAAPKSGSVKTT